MKDEAEKNNKTSSKDNETHEIMSKDCRNINITNKLIPPVQEKWI